MRVLGVSKSCNKTLKQLFSLNSVYFWNSSYRNSMESHFKAVSSKPQCYNHLPINVKVPKVQWILWIRLILSHPTEAESGQNMRSFEAWVNTSCSFSGTRAIPKQLLSCVSTQYPVARSHIATVNVDLLVALILWLINVYIRADQKLIMDSYFTKHHQKEEAKRLDIIQDEVLRRDVLTKLFQNSFFLSFI